METNLIPLISQDEIAAAVERLAAELDRDYRRRPPLLVGVLKGGFIFLADLIRRMKTPLTGVEFLRVSSYGSARISSGKARVLMGVPRQVIQGRDVIVVEDIIDTGLTTTAVLRYLLRRHPATLRVCTLLDKPARRRTPVQVDYVGITVPDRFLVGYGLDLGERYRQLPDIYTLED